MSNIWFTSDTHYSHANIAGPSVSSWDGGWRDFDSIEDMNDAIVESINSRVGSADILYHLGDWSFGGHHNIPIFRERINCENIVLIYGNHDRNIRRKYRDLFTETHEFLIRRLNNFLFTLSHYALRVWHQSHHGSFHLYGHSHGSLPGVGRSMDIGWDVWRRPLHIDEVVAELERKPVEFVDHHSEETN